MKTPVGTFGRALTREHPGGVFVFAFEGEDAGSVGEFARKVLQPKPAHDLAPTLEARHRDLWDVETR